MEARVGFEPTNGGFADLSLGPLGYRAKLPSIAKVAATARRLRRPYRAGVCFYFRARRKHSWRSYYFFSATLTIFASRKNLADSSGGVGLI